MVFELQVNLNKLANPRDLAKALRSVADRVAATGVPTVTPGERTPHKPVMVAGLPVGHWLVHGSRRHLGDARVEGAYEKFDA